MGFDSKKEIEKLYKELGLGKDFQGLPRKQQTNELDREMNELMRRMKRLDVLMSMTEPHLPDFAFYQKYKDFACEGLLYNGEELYQLSGRYCKLHSLWELLNGFMSN